jgi:hypothetical protein
MTVSFIVQRSFRQRAANAAQPLRARQHGTPDVRLLRLVCCRSRDRSRGFQVPVKTEGKIKGSARRRPLSQSARGVGAAQRLVAGVPSQNADPLGVSGDERMPSLTSVVESRRNWCHGIA